MFKAYAFQLLSILLLFPGFFYAANTGQDLFYGELPAVLESSYHCAPFKAQKIVHTLNGQAKYPYELNYAIFDGEPGVGKSTLAVAIAYKTKRKVFGLAASDFMTQANRNGTATAFNSAMQGIEDTHQGTVVIINEINHLFMNYDSKHHDTDASSMCFWTLLDKIKYNKNVFLIGTTNGIGGFPPQLISRLEDAIITMYPCKDLTLLRDYFSAFFKRKDVKLTDQARQYIEDKNFLEGCNARTLQSLAREVVYQAEENGALEAMQGPLVIKQQHIEAALKEREDVYKKFHAKPYRETELEQRERHHQETVALNRQQHQEALRQQRWQFFTGLIIGNAVNIAALVVNRSLHLEALQMQHTLHNQALTTQQRLHGESINPLRRNWADLSVAALPYAIALIYQFWSQS